ncbi:hypothetical protein HNQ07_004360 [Deinococcus metalli]|uniref:Bacterial Ig-like domain-containing protein n=1 Tax=Deinococcus metalli TaxID=1141878 RepID=A0A7W8KJC0_9DEIO|nr:hypothetical protein [Deinococcus metalli]MBB5378853.1 hypothetical protein [Deinococcus metalli]GHF62184.1 hypothetical protein GCM10017781_42830 [Deinococcus metalli]
MKKILPVFAALSIPMILASCGTAFTPAATASKGPLVSLRLNMGLGAQGLPTGGFAVAGAHLKVKVADSAGQPVTFTDGVYAPAGNGDAFLTLNAANNFGATVLLPKGQYTFETISKDGPDEQNTTGTLLAYSKTALTTVDASTPNVRLSVHAVMDALNSDLTFALPTEDVYTNDTLDLRLHVRTSGVDGTSFTVPTSDFSVGNYSATNGTLNTSTASKLGVSVLATGLSSDPSVTVSVPVTGWVRDGDAETASVQTQTVTFTHKVISGVVTIDVMPPSATVAPLKANLNANVTVMGTAGDDRAVTEARLYDGTTLVASTDASEQGEAVSTLSFPDGEGNWTAQWTPMTAGDHTLTLIVNDAAGNETRVDQSVTVAAQVIGPEVVFNSATSGTHYTLQPGETKTFRSAPSLNIDGYNGYYAVVQQYIFDAGWWDDSNSDCYSGTTFEFSAVDAATGQPVSVNQQYASCYVGEHYSRYYGSPSGDAQAERPMIFTVKNVSNVPRDVVTYLYEVMY